MIPKLFGSLRWIHGPNSLARKKNSSTSPGDADTQFVIVCQHSGDRLKAADFGKPALGGDNRSTQGKVDPLCQFRHQNPGEEIAGRSDGFELRAEIFFGDTAIKRSDGASALFDKRRDNFAEVVRANPHVAVREYKDLVLGFAGQSRQLVDLAIGPQIFSANKQANSAARKFGDQAMNQRNGRVLL